ncbi:ComF family protein [bacterium]|nr:ComF family protein [bacterium]
MEFAQRGLEHLLQIIFPFECISCGIGCDFNVAMCGVCANELRVPPSLEIEVTKKVSVKVHAAGFYEGPLRELVLKKHYKDLSASRLLANVMFQKIDFEKLFGGDIVLVPVPLHWTRWASRGFNQATMMAKFLSKPTGIPVAKRLVRRVRKTAFQTDVPGDERGKNVSGAFELKPGAREKLAGKHVVILDDLCTTGSTLKFVAREILRCHPEKISAVVACRAS